MSLHPGNQVIGASGWSGCRPAQPGKRGWGGAESALNRRTLGGGRSSLVLEPSGGVKGRNTSHRETNQRCLFCGATIAIPQIQEY